MVRENWRLGNKNAFNKARARRLVLEQPLDKDFRYIALTRGHIAIVDKEDYEWLMGWNWYCTSRGRKGIQDRLYPARRCEIDGKVHILSMHRQIMGIDLPRGTVVDHIDGNPFNNRRANLRICTQSENGMNKKVQSNNVSGLKGAHREPRGNRWKSSIRVNGRSKHLGYFNTPEAAHEAYIKAAKLHFGEFAYAC
jgi:hypothetical protein